LAEKGRGASKVWGSCFEEILGLNTWFNIPNNETNLIYDNVGMTAVSVTNKAL
jgi:hypothetical protein